MAKVFLVPVNTDPIPGELWIRWRHEIGWTQAEAGQWMGVHERTYENWERDGNPQQANINTAEARNRALRLLMLQAQKTVRPVPDHKRRMRRRKRKE